MYFDTKVTCKAKFCEAQDVSITLDTYEKSWSISKKNHSQRPYD